MAGNLMVCMSGGTTPVINATLAGIISAAHRQPSVERLLAGKPGLAGVRSRQIVDLSQVTKRQLKRLYHTPASGFIGTTRVAPLTQRETEDILRVFLDANVRWFVNIGGNGTIEQSRSLATALGERVSVVSVPKTVDNDLGDASFKQVVYTPGYPSCANYWRHKVRVFNQENLGACSHDKVLVAQTFGRKTGFIAAAARLADPQRKLPLLMLLPEDQRPLEEVIDVIEQCVLDMGRAIVVVSEGYDVGDLGVRRDFSGQVMYGSSTTTAAQLLVNHLNDYGIQSRAFIPGFDQRCESAFVCDIDLERAFTLGKRAVECQFEGYGNVFVSISRRAGHLEIAPIPLTETGGFSRVMPRRWISYGKFDVTDAFLEYATPLLGPTAHMDHAVTGREPFADDDIPFWKPNMQTTARGHCVVGRS